MAMSVGRGQHSMLSSINVTPMADIMILLIIFMVTIPLVRQGRVAEIALATYPYR